MTTGTRYVPIQISQMQALLEHDMGFRRADESTSWEAIWSRQVATKGGRTFPYTVKVYSSVDLRTNVSRDSGEDAIRLVLKDDVTGYAVKAAEKRVFRTKSALVNLRERARELFQEVVAGPHCPKCGALMKARRGGPGNHWFLGCSHYNPDKSWHCTGTRRVSELSVDQKVAFGIPTDTTS
jgi:hypothetical protein